MGYTHYYYLPDEIAPAQFRELAEDIERVARAARVPLAGGHGDGDPEFGPEAVVFNGVGDAAHETFRVDRVWRPRCPGREPHRDEAGRIFHFCKTAHKAYDVAVTAALVVLRHRLGAAAFVASDGDDLEWAEAKALCQDTLGYGLGYAIQGFGDDRGLLPVGSAEEQGAS